MNFKRIFGVSLTPTLAVQVLTQIVYIGFALNFAAHPRPLVWFFALLSTHVLIDYALRRFAHLQSHPKVTPAPETGSHAWIRLNIVAATISLFVNVEAFSYPALAIAGLFIFISKIWLIGPDGRHVYNPSAIASVLAITLLPQHLTYGGTSWGDFWHVHVWALPLAIAVAWLAKGLWISMSYVLGLSLASLAWHYVGSWLDLRPIWATQTLGPLFWIATLGSLGSMIFTFNIITDPQTSPRRRKEQWAFGFLIGVVDLVLRSLLIVMPDLLAYVFVQSGWFAYRLVRGESCEISEAKSHKIASVSMASHTND
ncbi:MAG TPA: hypothetical protein PLZ57_06650 [Pseudobdellovibrionaceae bacterium]|nr:hypothetical protein [Pseudobdellovibrionaceae bacterium]